MSQRPRAVVFGEEAAAYEQARPSYPDEAIAYIHGLVEARFAVEVGAGTGKATESMARMGLDLICLEPSPEMADILEAKDLPGVHVVRSSFEDWDPGNLLVDLVYAAQAWHWVDEGTGLTKTGSLLRGGGAVALMWNLPEHRYSEFEEIYRRHAPHILDEQDDRVRRRDGHDWEIDLKAAGFVDVDRFSWPWSAELDARQFRALYSTYSDHMMLPEITRNRLLDELEESVREQGGKIAIHYTTEVFSGRV